MSIRSGLCSILLINSPFLKVHERFGETCIDQQANYPWNTGLVSEDVAQNNVLSFYQTKFITGIIRNNQVFLKIDNRNTYYALYMMLQMFIMRAFARRIPGTMNNL